MEPQYSRLSAAGEFSASNGLSRRVSTLIGVAQMKIACSAKNIQQSPKLCLECDGYGVEVAGVY